MCFLSATHSIACLAHCVDVTHVGNVHWSLSTTFSVLQEAACKRDGGLLQRPRINWIGKVRTCLVLVAKLCLQALFTNEVLDLEIVGYSELVQLLMRMVPILVCLFPSAENL